MFSWWQKPERALRLEPAVDEPVDELLRLVGPAGGGDAEPERRVRGDEVDLVLVAEGDERLAASGSAKENSPHGPVNTNTLCAKSGPSQVAILAASFCWKRFGGPSFSIMQMRTGRGTGDAEPVDAGGQVRDPVDRPCALAGAVGAVDHQQRAAREEDRAGLPEQRLGLRVRVREERQSSDENSKRGCSAEPASSRNSSRPPAQSHQSPPSTGGRTRIVLPPMIFAAFSAPASPSSSASWQSATRRRAGSALPTRA